MEQSLKNQECIIKKLENKNEDLTNKNKNLELRVAVLEQGLKGFKQKSLSTSLEIASLPDIPQKSLNKVVQTIASKLEMNDQDIQATQKTPGSIDKPGPILIELKCESIRKQWVDAR